MNGLGCIDVGKNKLVTSILKLRKKYGEKMSEQNNSNYKNFLLGAIGGFLTVLGITLALVFWADVVSFFKGIVGMVFAIAGLGILYFLSKK